MSHFKVGDIVTGNPNVKMHSLYSMTGQRGVLLEVIAVSGNYFDCKIVYIPPTFTGMKPRPDSTYTKRDSTYFVLAKTDGGNSVHLEL